jgi:hypothetical protein
LAVVLIHVPFLPQPPAGVTLEDRLRAAEPVPKKKPRKKKQPAEIKPVSGRIWKTSHSSMAFVECMPETWNELDVGVFPG